MASNLRRAAIYARVSTEEQAEHNSSLAAQLELCRQYAVRLGAGEPLQQFVDPGVSGTQLKRPGLQALLEAVRGGRVDCVVCLDPDRLARNLAHQLILTEELDELGAELHFVQFDRHKTPDGRLLYAIRGAIAEFEAHKIRERMVQGKRQRLREGRVVTGTRIYGYRYDRRRRAFVIDPAEAAVVRLAFALGLQMGTGAVARTLQSRGLRAKNGGPFSQSAIYGMLRNHTYLGRMPQLGGSGYVQVPRIIHDELFAKVQQALDLRARRAPGGARRYLLTGIAVCAVCGRHMVGSGGARPYYSCTGKRGRTPCPSPYFPARQTEAAVWSRLAAALTRPALMRRLIDEQPAGAASELARLRRERRAMQRRRQRAAQRAADGSLDVRDYERVMAQIAARERALELASPSAAQRLAAQVEALCATQDLAERRLVLGALGLQVVLGRDRGCIVLARMPQRPTGG